VCFQPAMGGIFHPPIDHHKGRPIIADDLVQGLNVMETFVQTSALKEKTMDANECKKERFSSRSIGLVILVISMLLFIVGLVVLPVVGFIFAIPLLILGIAMIAAPESRACQLIREGLRIK